MFSVKILVLSVSAWCSEVGMNTWPMLLEGHDPNTIANIFLREEIPNSSACKNYFRISENRVLKSIFKRNIRTGETVSSEKPNEMMKTDLEEHNARYRRMRKKRRYSMLMAREIVWWLGKWKTRELDVFLDGFKPDIILHSMEGYIHLNRIVKYAIKHTGAKAIGYIWDDNFTYKQSSKLGYKIYRFFQRKSLKSLAKETSAFFAISGMTKREADDFFKIDCKILTKPLNGVSDVAYGEMNHPIKILYTGNLLIGRDRSLIRVVNAIKDRFEGQFVIDVYTKTEFNEGSRKEIVNDGVCRLHAPIPQSEVLEKQKEADVLLFLEDIDGPNAHTARLSFSTKITDYLSSGKCIFAVGCADTAPMQYFIENCAAVVATSDREIVKRLAEIVENREILKAYAERARVAGIKNHSKEKVLNTFNETLISVFEGKE